jgi:hypothetical protein
MTSRLAFLAVLAGLFAGDGAAATPKAAAFSTYPAPAYHGPIRQPDFQGAQRPYATYRTMIRRSVQQGVRFGGHYAVAVVGCGTGCRFGYLTDVRTGLVYDLPNGGEDYVEVEYGIRADSRLLKTQWVRLSKDYDRIGCAFEDFVWTGKAFRSLGKRTTAEPCEDQPDTAPAT